MRKRKRKRRLLLTAGGGGDNFHPMHNLDAVYFDYFSYYRYRPEGRGDGVRAR